MALRRPSPLRWAGCLLSIMAASAFTPPGVLRPGALEPGRRCPSAPPTASLLPKSRLPALRSRRGAAGLVGCESGNQVKEKINFTADGAGGSSGERWKQWYGMANKDQLVEERKAAAAAALLDDDDAPGGGGSKEPKDTLERLVSGTYTSLDWMVLKKALAKCGRTSMGRAALGALKPYEELRDVERAHAAIAEVRQLREQGVNLPISQVKDVVENVNRAGKGEVLSLEEIFDASKTLVALREIEKLLANQEEVAPTLCDIGQLVHVEGAVVQQLERSFDATGALNPKTYPQLEALRREIDRIGASITTTMDSIVKSSKFNDMLQDKFYTIRDNRFVLPVAIVNKNKVDGIVHGMSGTGSTVYIEPQQVIDLNNKLRMAEGELRAEENRILRTLSSKLGTQTREVKLSVNAVTEMDMAYAREDFAEKIKAVRPTVGVEGAVDLRTARHPVLVLRGVKPVANDIALSKQQPGLVISGPNAGGKTVALKTVGLCALLVQHGCWIPVDEGSRMDLFSSVFAAIGDQQTVQEDLSSFSSHLLTLNTMMEHAGESSLVLLDEIASGTDPAQGAALAQAVLERMLETGPRMVVTTHYAQLKALATVDSRFAVAAMQYIDGAPTYKVLHGVTGESHAFSIAKKMGILEEVLERAGELMGEQAKMTKTLEALEEERAKAQIAAEEQERLRKELQRKLKFMEEREEALRSRSKELERKGAEEFLKRLSDAESTIGQVVKDLQKNPNFKEADSARSILDGVRNELFSEVMPEGPPPVEELQVGDSVELKDIGGTGEVLSLPDKKGDLQVRVGGLNLRTNLERITRLSNDAPQEKKQGRQPRAMGGSQTLKKGKGGGNPKARLSSAVRTPGNTLDLRGKRAEMVGDEVDRFLDGMMRGGSPYAFILTGHGTGVLKKVVREHLKTSTYAAAHGPADFEQGGDALFVVALK